MRSRATLKEIDQLASVDSVTKRLRLGERAVLRGVLSRRVRADGLPRGGGSSEELLERSGAVKSPSAAMPRRV